MFNLEIEGDGTHPVLIWATQRDPITSRFTHIDFYGVDLDKPVKITVPVEFTEADRVSEAEGWCGGSFARTGVDVTLEEDTQE